MKQALEPLMFTGLGSVAVWLYVRYPNRRPATVMRAIGHVAVSFGVFMATPFVLGLCLGALGPRAAVPVFVVGVLMPVLTYLLLSWVWLLAGILRELGGGSPRGGHPVGASLN